MINKISFGRSGVGAAMFATGAVAAGHDFKIVYIGKNTGNPYFDSHHGGFEDACKQIGCAVRVRGAGDRRSDLADPVHRGADPARRQRDRDRAQQPGRA